MENPDVSSNGSTSGGIYVSAVECSTANDGSIVNDSKDRLLIEEAAFNLLKSKSQLPQSSSAGNQQRCSKIKLSEIFYNLF